jgi:hypothetical protein
MTAAIVALAAVGMVRIVWLHFGSEPTHAPRRMPIDQQYQALRSLVHGTEAGYVSDLPAAMRLGEDPSALGTRMYLQAQFALAPLVLKYDDARAPLVIANLADPKRLSELLQQRGLELVAPAGPGLALARPR